MSVKKLLWLLLIVVAYLTFTVTRGEVFSWGSLGLIALCFSCELMDSSLGMGYGTTLTPILLAFGYQPLQLIPTILLSELLSGFASSYFHHDSGNVDFSRNSRDSKTAWLLALGSMIGVIIGVNVAVQIPTVLLKLFIGVIITLAGISIWILNNRTFVYKTWKMCVLALIASFNKALSGGGYGPLMTSGQILSGINSRASVGITSFAEGFTCLVGVILFLGKGQKFAPELMIPVITGALLSVPFSTEFVKHINEAMLKRVIAVLTTILGIFTLCKVFL